MRVLELEINYVRGIPHMLLKPNGKNFVIWGPNGSGKSAVVDAIDFLLTGRISRLTGAGTGGISLSRHGPHIDHQPEDAKVRAVVHLPGVSNPVELKRCMARPNVLEYDRSLDAHVRPIMTLAQRGQYVLTRREILKYITAEASTRAQEIQDLLNIAQVEDIRKALVTVQNTLDRELQAARRAVSVAQGAVNATVQQTVFQTSVVLQVINQNRSVLGGPPIAIPRHGELKTGLQPPTVISTDQSVNTTLLQKDIQNLHNVASGRGWGHLAKIDKELRASLHAIRSDSDLLSALQRSELTKLGISLIDETGRCPLCDTAWPKGKLRGYLEGKLTTAQLAGKYRKQIEELSRTIAEAVDTTIPSLQRVVAATERANIEADLPVLKSWLTVLHDIRSSLVDPIGKYPNPECDSEQIARLLGPGTAEQHLSHIDSVLKQKYPQSTPEQTAWDTLTALQENLKGLEEAQCSLSIAELGYQRASLLLHSFQTARDAVLGDLYNSIKDRFVGLYRRLHGSDELGFTANLQPDGAGLNLGVDFYGRGVHPPHALHSEGHQDSMGLCLYLTLAERLNGSMIDLIILDDVVMSVDKDHRRQLCRLLGEFFPNRQFLITTHDQTWSNQLKSEGVVSLQETLEFRNWSVDTGPEVFYVSDAMWNTIGGALSESNVGGAAHQLRRGSEEFFAMVCDALQVPVVYKLSGQWEFGELLMPAMDRYKELLKRAQKAAQSWGNSEESARFQELDSIRSEVYKRTYAEQWAVNPNVHYNNWLSFSKEDFQPVVEAFYDLYRLFVCSKCGGMLQLASVERRPAGVRCNCGVVNWNLIAKSEQEPKHAPL